MLSWDGLPWRRSGEGADLSPGPSPAHRLAHPLKRLRLAGARRGKQTVQAGSGISSDNRRRSSDVCCWYGIRVNASRSPTWQTDDPSPLRQRGESGRVATHENRVVFTRIPFVSGRFLLFRTVWKWVSRLATTGYVVAVNSGDVIAAAIRATGMAP